MPVPVLLLCVRGLGVFCLLFLTLLCSPRETECLPCPPQCVVSLTVHRLVYQDSVVSSVRERGVCVCVCVLLPPSAAHFSCLPAVGAPTMQDQRRSGATMRSRGMTDGRGAPDPPRPHASPSCGSSVSPPPLSCQTFGEMVRVPQSHPLASVGLRLGVKTSRGTF